MSLKGDADWDAEQLTDRLFEWLSARPQRADDQAVREALHEWLKSQLALLGVAISDQSKGERAT